MKCFGLLWSCLLLGKSLTAQGLQVVITELLPDPVPSIGLPAAEFIELTNVSGKTIDLSGWWLSNGRSKALLPDSSILPADSMLIVCGTSAAVEYAGYGHVLALPRMPGLSNVTDTIALYDRQGALIHIMGYTLSDFGNDATMSGRSIEMINLSNACSLKDNWRASERSNGGSPGRRNQFADPPSLTPGFDLRYVYPAGDSAIVLVFDDQLSPEALDLRPEIVPELKTKEPRWNNVLHSEIRYTLTTPLQPGVIYNIDPVLFFSCLDVPAGNSKKLRFGLPDSNRSGLIINEILFDPPPAGSDYVELYNAGDAIVDLQHFFLSNRSSNRMVGRALTLSTSPHPVCPGDYLVFSTQPNWLRQHYLLKNPTSVLALPVLPSWPNDKGSVILLKDSSIVDEVDYADDWHQPMLSNREGIALERIKPLAPSQDRSNWQSAALQAGYGTPGYENSQSPDSGNNKWRIWPDPLNFSPNGDGRDDVCRIHYQFNEPGMVMTTAIYNRNGQLLRYLARNTICGTRGDFIWDGRDERGRTVAPDLYLLFTEVFTLDGRTRRFRQALTVGY